MKKNHKRKKKGSGLHNPRTQYRRTFVRRMFLSVLLGIVIGAVTFIFNRDMKVSLIVALIATVIIQANFYIRIKLAMAARVKKMESVFPDFLQLMSSNLRAGITIDRSMLLSAREEFDPLDKEILKTGRDITTGKSIGRALLDMADRIHSDKIAKTINLILSGIKAGGDVATLLEETASHMREKGFMEKKAASSVLMYVIFIFLAVAVAAPALFALSNILVEVLTSLLGNLPELDASISTPFTLSAINVSTTFIFYFSLLFILAINLMASMTLGLVSKGSEREGLKYFVPITLISYVVFFLLKTTLSGVVAGFFA